MKILITGLSGLVGSELAARLAFRYPENVYACILRRHSSRSLNPSVVTLCNPEHIYHGDLEDVGFIDTVVHSFRPDVVVHLAQIRFTPSILDSLLSLETLPRLIVLGTTGVFSRSDELSKRYKQAEADLCERYPSSLFSVIRSNLIYGSCRDKNFHKLFESVYSGRPILLPAFGSSLYQPIYYKDLAHILEALIVSREYTTGFINVAGPSVVSLLTILSIISLSLGRSPFLVWFPSLPLFVALRILELLFSFPVLSAIRFPVTSEQVLRLSEHKIYRNQIHEFFPAVCLTPIEMGLFYQAREMSLARHGSWPVGSP